MRMSIAVLDMPYEKVKYLQDLMVEAGIARNAGGDWREVFRRAKHKHVAGSRMYKILGNLESTPERNFEKAEATLLNEIE